jgi:hypothetical protein
MNRKMTLKLALAFMASGGVAFAQVPTELITFDDINTGGFDNYVAIANGYAGLDWNDFYAENSLGNGYTTGIVSQPNAAFEGFGSVPASFSAPSGTFDLASAYLTAAFQPETVEVQGFDGAALVYDNTYSIIESSPTLIDFNYSGITSVTLFDPALQQGDQVVMDNVQINGSSAPDGGMTVILLGGALTSLGLLRRKLS